jgi:hypothetical protein
VRTAAQSSRSRSCRPHESHPPRQCVQMWVRSASQTRSGVLAVKSPEQVWRDRKGVPAVRRPAGIRGPDTLLPPSG